jgi:hypothetical protein
MAPVTQLERDAPPLRTETVHRLEMLAGTLTERGMGVSLIAPAGRVPRLQVAHPAADGETGDVYASRGRNGNWWFWWPWAERIAEEGDLDAAAAIIDNALAARLLLNGRRPQITVTCWDDRTGPGWTCPGQRGPGPERVPPARGRPGPYRASWWPAARRTAGPAPRTCAAWPG